MSFDSVFKRMWEQGRKIDPLTHKAIEKVVAQDSRNVRTIARGLGLTALEREADKNVNDPVRGIGRAAATTGLLYGGYALMSGGGAAGGASAAEAAMATPAAPTGSVFIPGADSAATSAAAGYSNMGSAAVPSAVDLGELGGVQSTGRTVNWARMGDAVASMTPPRKPQYPVEPSNVEIEQPDLAAIYGMSSKQAKQSPDGGADAAIARGATGADPIDTNGVQIAAIQALSRRTKALRARIDELAQRQIGRDR
ncbi:MAG: hypothetical protein LKCHEGNO_01626 [Burkholderiaceae bacterium]|nr:hypothetical protein [Burkholderiaceae bacterium]